MATFFKFHAAASTSGQTQLGYSINRSLAVSRGSSQEGDYLHVSYLTTDRHSRHQPRFFKKYSAIKRSQQHYHLGIQHRESPMVGRILRAPYSIAEKVSEENGRTGQTDI